MGEPVSGQVGSNGSAGRPRGEGVELNSIVHWIVGSDWLWLPVLAVSAMIIVAAMVVTGAATAAAFVVPYRSRTGRTNGSTGGGRGEVRQAPRFTSPPREASPGPRDPGGPPTSFGEPAWGGSPLGGDVETRSA